MTRAVSVFFGSLQKPIQRREFWQTAMFTKYVQVSVGGKARIRPTLNGWDSGKTAFSDVLERYRPDFVLALGKELWPHLGHPAWIEGRRELDGEAKPYFRTHTNSFLFGINHPTSWGWSYRKWTPWVEAALSRARAEIGTSGTPL
jgi:hypothetical protein